MSICSIIVVSVFSFYCFNTEFVFAFFFFFFPEEFLFTTAYKGLFVNKEHPPQRDANMFVLFFTVQLLSRILLLSAFCVGNS